MKYKAEPRLEMIRMRAIKIIHFITESYH